MPGNTVVINGTQEWYVGDSKMDSLLSVLAQSGKILDDPNPEASEEADCAPPRERELKVYYAATGLIETDIDDAIEQALKPFGFERIASGYDLTSNVRNLLFENRATSSGNPDN